MICFNIILYYIGFEAVNVVWVEGQDILITIIKFGIQNRIEFVK
jgi:hypothetical protein